MRRLSEYFNETAYHPAQPLDIIEGKEVMILGFRTVAGKYGPMAIMYVDTGDFAPVKVRTGIRSVIEALMKASTDNAFPVAARFVRDGNRWKIE